MKGFRRWREDRARSKAEAEARAVQDWCLQRARQAWPDPVEPEDVTPAEVGEWLRTVLRRARDSSWSAPEPKPTNDFVKFGRLGGGYGSR